MQDTITLNFTNYILKGEALIIDWFDQRCAITMKDIERDNLDNITIDDLNDNGFGCQSIEGAYIQVYKNYEGYLVYDSDLIVGDLSDKDIDFLMEGV